MSNDKKIARFLSHIRSQCKKLQVDFRLSNAEGINSGDGDARLLGIFVPPTWYDGVVAFNGSLRVAIKNRRKSAWIVDVAHEYVHMMQWFRGDPIYKSHFKGDVSYAKLEAATEKEALILLEAWDIPVGSHQKKRSKRYVAKLRLEERSK
jgi:hypothetical protein